MSLSRAVGAAVDAVFAVAPLQAFSRLDAARHASIRCYYRRVPGAEWEITVYRDKWWGKAGGRVYLELFCLVAEVQRLLGGCEQSWLNPDYSRPLEVFQYRTSNPDDDTQWEITSVADVVPFTDAVREALQRRGLPWLESLTTREGVVDHLLASGAHLTLAALLVGYGDAVAARAAFARYLCGYPREIDGALAQMTTLGVIDAAEQATLARASLQAQEAYARAVQQWCTVHGVAAQHDG